MMTVDEAKAMAEENEYDTEPNDEGEIEKRPGKLSDYLPSPYKNDEAARAANNGALPRIYPSWSKPATAGCNYIFSLLTGYPEEPPAGANVQSGLNFNPYFPGTGIAMARVLYDGLVEYEDGTSATTSQMAKDVVEFLNWTAEPEMDERKKMGIQVLIIGSVLLALSGWVKRYKWAPIKTRKIIYNPPGQKPGFQMMTSFFDGWGRDEKWEMKRKGVVSCFLLAREGGGSIVSRVLRRRTSKGCCLYRWRNPYKFH